MKLNHYIIKKKVRTLLLFFILLLSTPLSAQNVIWQPLTKPGGEIMTSFISISKDSLVAATLGGVYLSTNEGAAWQRFGLKNVNTGCIYRHSNGRLFVSAFSENGYVIYKKTDMGGNWEQLPFVFDNYVLLIEGTEKDILFVSTENKTYKSEDLGNTWHTVAGIGGKVSSIVELSDGTLFASVEDDAEASGIYRSQDNGETWQQIGLAGISIPTLTKNKGEILYAGSNDYNDNVYENNAGLYKSADKGETWERVNSECCVYNLVIDDNNVFYMCEFIYSIYGFSYGYWIFSNEGIDWSNYYWGIDYLGAENLFLASDGYLYVYGATLLYRTINPVISGITNVSSLSFSVYPNPFTEKLQIDGITSDRATISVSDIQGREVYHGIYTGAAINLSHLLPGVYILTVKADGKRGAYKIVKSMSN